VSGIWGPIYWTEFSWEAFAALVTGIAAVGGAIYIGKRQTKIAERQTEILNRQTLLSEQELRIQLLEKRAACVAAMRELVGEWNRRSRLSKEDINKFRRLSWDAQLLYPPEIAKKIDQAFSGTFWSKHYGEQANNLAKAGQSDRAMKHLEMSFEEEDKAMEVMPDLINDLVEHTRVAGWQAKV
jgi:hypothetical protein